MVKKITLMLFMVLGVLLMGQSITVKAEDIPTFYIQAAEPATSETQGYVVILLQNKTTSVLTPTVYFWNTIASTSGNESPAYAHITIGGSTITFTVGGHSSSSSTTAYYSLMQINSSGEYLFLKNSSSSSYTRTFDNETIVGWHYNGNVGSFSPTVPGRTFNYYFTSSGESVILQDILYTLAQSNSIDSNILGTVQSILNSVDGVENQLSSVVTYLRSVDSKLTDINTKLASLYSKADEILAEQKTSNTWLEKIFNYLNESQEQQKQEAQTQGDSSVSQGNSAIEDKGAGFTDSLGNLTSSMSYTGTQCAWEFPTVKLPAIAGVMDEVTLVESQPIDFSQWVNAIPSSILLVVQSVCTVGLIVYCFKELYSTIAYVLTLRKDDNS